MTTDLPTRNREAATQIVDARGGATLCYADLLRESAIEIERLRAEHERVTQDRNEAMAVVYAAEEWMAGRITDDDLRGTVESIIAEWEAAEAAGGEA